MTETERHMAVYGDLIAVVYSTIQGDQEEKARAFRMIEAEMQKAEKRIRECRNAMTAIGYGRHIA